MKKNAIVKKGMWIVGLALMLGISLAAFGFSQTGDRVDCPGKVVCPLTGEEVCQDQCPLVDANRADCPGKIECPITGELVCRDKCPVGTAGSTVESGEDLPPCCRGKK